jgi:hypothetical protein
MIGTLVGWVGWKIIGGFFKVNWKWLTILIAGLLLLWGAWSIASTYSELREMKSEKEQTISDLRDKLNQETFEKLKANDALARERVNKKLIEELRADYLQAKQDIRSEVKAELAVFTKDRKYTFDEMVQAKPGLIQHLANNATREYHDEMAILFND